MAIKAAKARGFLLGPIPKEKSSFNEDRSATSKATEDQVCACSDQVKTGIFKDKKLQFRLRRTHQAFLGFW